MTTLAEMIATAAAESALRGRVNSELRHLRHEHSKGQRRIEIMEVKMQTAQEMHQELRDALIEAIADAESKILRDIEARLQFIENAMGIGLHRTTAD